MPVQGENVEYTLSLKDLFTGKLAEADSKAKAFELTMGQVGAAIAGAFAVTTITNFLSTSVQAFNEAEKSSAQLTASLKSTGAESWKTKEALEAQSLALMRMSRFDDDVIEGAQSILLTFTSIKGAIYDQAMPAILDMSTKMGTDLNSTVLQVGKALNDPIQGISALTRVGVTFSNAQKDVIKNLAETGNLAEAQKMILAELNKEFGGSAQADANTYAGQMAILHHEFMNVKEEIGGMVAALLIKLKPAMEWMIEKMKEAVHWIKENETGLKAVAISIGVMAAAWTAYLIPSALATAATLLMEGAFWALSVAMTANPIGLVIAGLAALAGAFYYAWNASEKFRGVVMGVWEVLKGFGNFIVSYFSNIGEIIAGVFSLDADRIKNGISGALSAYKDLATGIGDNFNKGYEKGVKSFIADSADGTASPSGKKGQSTAPMPGASGKSAPKAGSVTGQKSYVVNISINDLIKEFNISTTNLTEGAGKIKELVTQALLSAVNDSQIIAER